MRTSDCSATVSHPGARIDSSSRQPVGRGPLAVREVRNVGDRWNRTSLLQGRFHLSSTSPFPFSSFSFKALFL